MKENKKNHQNPKKSQDRTEQPGQRKKSFSINDTGEKGNKSQESPDSDDNQGNRSSSNSNR